MDETQRNPAKDISVQRPTCRSMPGTSLAQKIYKGIYAGDVAKVRQLLTDYPEVLEMDIIGQTWLHHAAKTGNVALVEVLVEAGLDVNVPRSADFPERPLCDAARYGCVEVARWLLDHGAKVNAGGGMVGTPLTSSIVSGSIEMVRLLLEYGADIHVSFGSPPENALSLAVMHGHRDIVQLLQSHGAVQPGTESAAKAHTQQEEILQHVEKHIGPVEPLALAEIVQGIVPITIHVVPPDEGRRHITLITTGMSDRPMTVPQGYEEYRYAELVVRLPSDWPLTKEAFKSEDNYWPIEWLRRLAHYPHENDTWLGEGHVISNEDPPEPVAPGTALSSFLLLQEPTDFGSLRTSDGELINFYEVFPLYKEERDIQQLKGTVYLVELFQKYRIPGIIDMNRVNVVEMEKGNG